VVAIVLEREATRGYMVAQLQVEGENGRKDSVMERRWIRDLCGDQNPFSKKVR
jgi:hypothetical protein